MKTANDGVVENGERLNGSATRRTAFILLLVALATLGAVGCEDSTVTPGARRPDDLARPAYSEPIWSPDGSTLGFNHVPLDSITVEPWGHEYHFRDSLGGFWMVDTAGANLRRVADFLFEPDWSADGMWIAFERGGDIWKIGVSGSGIDSLSARQLTFLGQFFSPAWNGAGTMLAFYKPSGPTAGVYRIGSGGGAPEWIGSPGWRYPDYSPNDSRLAFVGTVSGTYGIGVADSNGMLAEILRSGLIGPQSPRWSPDGSRLAFLIRTATSGPRLWMMDSLGSNARQLVGDPVGEGFAWSPDGSQIAYVRQNFADYSLTNGTVWIVDVATGSTRQITFNGTQVP